MNRLRQFWRYCLLLIFRRGKHDVEVQTHPAQSSPAQAQPAAPAFPRPERSTPPSATVAPASSDAPPARAADDAPIAPPIENRHSRRRREALRRRLERARMRHDEWVKPGGLEPVKHERAETEHEPKPPLPAVVEDDWVDPNDHLIGDEWVEGDGGGDVLFEMSEFYGTYNFRDTILRQLDRYWVYIERMKRRDPDAYGFYKRLGATLVPYCATGANRNHEYFHKYRDEDELAKFKAEIKLTPWFKQTWPAFGCLAYGVNPLEEERERSTEFKGVKGALWTPKFFYFTRINTKPWPWFVQPVSGGKLYLLTVWWDRPDHPKIHEKWGVPNEFPIWISDDGEKIRALKTREASNGYRPEHDWRIPYAYEKWAKQYGLTAQLHLSHMFASASMEIERTYYATCRVEVSKGDLTAVFGIEPQRCPYFFRDRDVTLDAHGHKQRVFHSVRPHVRADGTAIPLQYRGLKEFTWAGYAVSITVPGRDHLLLQEFDVPLMMLKRGSRRPKDSLAEPDFANWLKEKIKAGIGGYNH